MRERSSTTRVVAALALAAAWISAGAAPLEGALGAAAPIDFARDYVAATARAHGVDDAAVSNEYAASLGVPAVVVLDAPYYAHPPPATLALLPLVPLGFRRAALAWLAVNLLALAALAALLVRVAWPDARGPAQAAAFALLALWPPVLHDLAKGQWSLVLAALIAGGWVALDAGRARAAGVLLGVAACLKATPLLLLGFLVRRERRAAIAMLATIALTVGATLALYGAAPWHRWLTSARPNALAWQTWVANTASINGLFARLFAGGPFARPIVACPALAQALTLTAAASLVAAAAWATHRESTAGPRAFAAWTILVVLLNPISWTHTVIIALLAVALLVRDASPGVLAVALIALTVPRETLAVLAGPTPVAPLRGLALSLHAGALLLLFMTARAPAPLTPTAGSP